MTSQRNKPSWRTLTRLVASDVSSRTLPFRFEDKTAAITRIGTRSERTSHEGKADYWLI